MFYRFATQIQHEVVEYLKRVLKRQTSWTNVDFGQVDISFGETHRAHVYENYYREREEYPVVVISVGPATSNVLSLSDCLPNVVDEQSLGVDFDDYGVIGGSGNKMWATNFTSDSARNLKSATFTLASDGGIQGDILVSLVSGSGNLPDSTILTSGSIKGFSETAPGLRRVDFDSIKGLEKDFSGWLTLQSDALSPYKLYLASGSGSNIAYNTGSWILDNAKTPIGAIQGATYQRLGGGVESNLTIDTAAKDEATAKDLADTVAMYLLLSRQTKLLRSGTDQTDIKHTGWLAEKGIYLSDISFGGVTVRKRGDQNIFVVNIGARCWGHWYQDYSTETLKEIEVDVTGY